MEDILFCMRQFLILLEACPEQEVKISEKLRVPIIFYDDSKYGMMNAFKHDPVWESTRAKVESIISSVKTKLKTIETINKHCLFMENIDSHGKANVDVIVNKQAFEDVESGFDLLRNIFSDISDLEKLFEMRVGGNVLVKNPLSTCLESLKTLIDESLSAHKDVELITHHTSNDFNHLLSSVPTHIREKMESFLNKVLCIIQNVYKNHVLGSKLDVPETTKQQEIPKTLESEEENEIIVDGHLKDKIVERLINDFNTLRLSEISQDIGNILADMLLLDDISHKEACQGYV